MKANDSKKNKKNRKEYRLIGKEEAEEEFNKLCGSCHVLEDETAAAKELTKLVEEYIVKNNWVNEETPPTPAWYFYTTIPEDNSAKRNEFGDVFRYLDDFFYGLQGCDAYCTTGKRRNFLPKNTYKPDQKKSCNRNYGLRLRLY